MANWIMSCGAIKHSGTKRDHGALINWRYRINGWRKVHRQHDDTPWLLKRFRGVSELNRRIIPAHWRYPLPDGHYAEKHRKLPIVLNRGTHTREGGPVGIKYRWPHEVKL